MKKNAGKNHGGKSEKERGRKAEFELRLYIAGQTPKSLAAISNLRKICTEHLDQKYRIEVIDLMQKPHLAQNDQIVAIPTLVRNLPTPIRKIIGDLSNTERVLVGLEIHERDLARAATVGSAGR